MLALTGAGISAESGIPTFRGADGYWRNLDPMTLASPAGFAADPALVWEWYRERRAGIRASQPNAAHVAVTRLALEVPEFLLVTQNVDDLHRRATHNGRTLPEDRIAQIHGDIFIDRCEGCDQWGRESLKEDTSVGVPRCDACGARMRPGVVWFGEILDPALLARVESFVSNAGCTVIVVGTTAQFGYIVDWSVRASRGGRLIEINPERTPLSDLATEVIRAPATASLPALVERLLTP